MPKTSKKQKQLLPQKTFITLALIAYLLNVTYSIALVIRVYSTKQIWFSPFLAMSITEILLPPALLAISYLMLRRQMYGLSLKFCATLLTVIGMLLNLIISQLYHLPILSFGMWTMQVLNISGFLIASLLIVLIASKANRNSSQKPIYSSFMGLVIGMYFVQAIIILKDAIWRYTHGQELSQLPLDAIITHGLILPIIFFTVAYLLFTKSPHSRHRLLVTTVYGMVGFLITIALTALWMVVTQIPSYDLIDYDLAMSVLSPVAGLAIYLAIIIGHKILSVRNLKTNE